MNNFKLTPEIFKYKLEAKSLHVYCYLLANKNKRVMNYELEKELHNLNKETLAKCFYELKEKKLISPKPDMLKNTIKCRYLCKDFDIKNDNAINFNRKIFMLNLSHIAFQIYLYLRANINTRVINKQIINELNISTATLYKYLKELKIKGFISKNKKFITIF